MKSKSTIKVIIITLGIFFALFTINTTNLNFNMGYCDDNTLYNKNLELLKVSGKIHIDGNSGWFDFRNAGNCTGNGTYSNPYIIKDLAINGEGSGSCILIENSDVYFRIETCSCHHSGNLWNDAGIKIYNTTNGILNNNTCHSNFFGISILESDNIIIFGNDVEFNMDYGIYLSYSNSNTILVNTVKLNYWSGIYLSDCNNNTLSENIVIDSQVIGILLDNNNNNNTLLENTINSNGIGICIIDSNKNTLSGNKANYNHDYGICFSGSVYNTVTGNTANDNRCGIYLYESNNNLISGNTFIDNDECIAEESCEGNIFENNQCGEDDKEPIIHGYNLFFLLGILSVIVIFISKKLKKY
ncbi:MAG: nitrous oxide reductase family maturation protein NosD [Promethearchaeota archaeon]